MSLGALDHSLAMSPATDLDALVSTVMRDSDLDLEAFFGHFAADCRFAWGNEEPVQGLEAIQSLAGRMLAGVSQARHEVLERLLGEDSAAVRLEMTYTLPDGSTLHTPAVSYMRFRGERICEYRIYQDPTPLKRAAEPLAGSR
jgi:ketosteroid isomerase-like protein